MIESRLVTRKNQIEMELRRGVRDPRRKQYLTARLLQIENNCRCMGYSEAEIRNNDVNTGHDNTKTVESNQILVPLASWVAEPKQDQKEDNQTNFERVKSYREEMYARRAAFENNK